MNILRKFAQRLNSWPLKKAQSRSVDVLTGYARWARSYPAEAHNPLMVIEEQAMLGLLPDLAGKVCLDLACGSGRYLRHLARRGARLALGADYSPEMLAQAQSTELDCGLVRCPFVALPFPHDTFDLITCALGVGHERSLASLLAEAGRVLRPGGLLIYSDFHPFAALSGWQRTFTANGTTFRLEHYVHLYSDHLSACQAVGLTIEAVLEPVGGKHAPPRFDTVPVVLAIRAAKPSNPAVVARAHRNTKISL